MMEKIKGKVGEKGKREGSKRIEKDIEEKEVIM